MKKRIISLLLAVVMVVSLFPVTASAETAPTAPDTMEVELPFTPFRNAADEELYSLTRRGNGNIKIDDEFAWIAGDMTPDEFISVGVPDNAGIIKVVEKSDWEAYCTDKVDFYLDVLKSGYGFDGCEHGTLNFDCTEYNCWQGGVQHLKGVAYDYSAKHYYSRVIFRLNENGIPAADKTVQLYDGRDYFDLTDKGNGVYESNTVFLGKYIIYVDGEPTNQGVEVDNKTFGGGYFCDVVNGEIVRNDDSVHATAYYSGYEYEVGRYVYDYDISVYYNGELSDALGTLTFVTSGKAHTLTKTDAGRYKGSIIFPNPIESENVNLCLGNTQTGAYFQTVRNSDEEYTNNSIKIEYYDETVTLKVNGEPFSGRLVGFDNGSIQYLRETDENGVITLPVKLVRDGETEMPYTVSVYGVTDNLATPTQLSLGSRSAELNYVTVSFITDDETKPYRTQYVRSGSAPNKVGAAVMDGLSFSCWSLAPWDKEEDVSTVEKFDFSAPVTAACKVYAHSTVPVLDIYGTSVGTDLSGNIVDAGSATAFRLPAVTIAGFTSGNASIQSFSLELTNIDKVYFYNTSDVTITTGDGSELQSDNGGYSTTAKKVAVSFKQMVSMSVAQEYIRNNVVFVPTSGKTAEINLSVSNEIISVEDKSTVEQSKYSDTKWKKLSEVSGNVLQSGFYYVDKNITKAATAVNTNGLVINGTVYLYIPEGKTLTAKGYAGYFKEGPTTLTDEIYPGTAGILLSEGNSLYVYGKGTLKAQGGNAVDGSNGYDGSTALSSPWIVMSAGGCGGRGGSGAGAGIGTNGAALDPTVDKRLSQSSSSGSNTKESPGKDGYDGPDSRAADEMGALFIAKTVTVDAHGGAAGKSGTAGGKAGVAQQNVTFDGAKMSIGASGGGGAGYGGHAGADIGKGGATGASGGSGGSGSISIGNKSGNAGGGGKGAVNGAGTQSGTGGAGGKVGTDINPKVGESVTPGVPSVSDGHEFNYTVTFDGSGQAAIPYFMEEKEITVPDYAGDLGANELCLGWKVKTYGNTFGTASASDPLTTAENTVYVPGSEITLSASTYGDIVFVPIISSVPGVTASDTLSLTSAGPSELYTYTLNLKCNGTLTDLGTLVFTDNNGKKYNVNSASGDDAGKYVLTLSSEVSIVKIELNGTKLFADDLSTPLALSNGESKTANTVSMEIAVSGKDVTQVSVSGDYSLEYSETLSTEGTSVFVVYAQTDDVNLYNITVDNEAIPASVAQAKFGTRATVAYTTVNVAVTTNVTDPLSLCLKVDGGVTVPLAKSGAIYSATVLSTGETEYTLYVDDTKTDVTVKLDQATVDAAVVYYKISVVSKVNGTQGATDHTIAVNGVNAVTLDNVSFEAFVLSGDECTVTSNGTEVAKVTPSATLGSTDVNYYTVTYATGTDCTGTLPVDNTLYLAGQEATIAGLGGLTATSAGYYVAGWQLGDKVYNEGNTVVVTGKLTLTALAAQDDLIIHYVDHFGKLGTVSHLPLTQKITVAEMNGLKGSFTEGLVKYSFKGWTLEGDTTHKIYSIYEETEFTPQDLLGGAATKEVIFRAVYDVEYLKGITIEAALPEGKTVQGINQVGQTFTIDYRISGNDVGINKLVLIPAYDSDKFAIENAEAIVPKNDAGLGTGTVTDLGYGRYTVAFDSDTLYSNKDDIVVSITYKVIKVTSGEHDFGFALNYAENTLNGITFDDRSYAYKNPETLTGSLDPSQEVKITFDGSKIKARTLTDASITITPNQSVPYTGSAVTIAHTDLTGDLHFTYSGYEKQEDCVQDKAKFTIKWYDAEDKLLNEAPKDAGTYSVGVSASASDYYNAVDEVKQTFTISKVDKPADTPVVYEVNAISNSSLSLETIGIKLQGAKITNVAAVSGNIGKVLSAAPTIDTGDKSISWTTVPQPSGTENDQYTLTVSSDNWNDFTVTVDFKGKIPVTVNATGENFVYGDKNKTGYTGLSVTDNLVDAATLEFLYESTGTTATYSSKDVPTNVGTYKVTISVPESNTTYIGSTTVEFAITQQEVAVPAENETKFTYDGEEKTYMTIAADALYKLAEDSAATSRTDAGETTIKLVLKDTHNYKWANGATDPSYTFNIEKREIEIDWVKDDFTYNGSNQTSSVTASYKDVNGMPHSLIVAVKQGGDGKDFKNAGAYTAEVTGFDTANDPGSKNYKLPAPAPKTYTMKQKAVTVLDVMVEDKIYNGETNDVAFSGAAVFDGLCDGDTLTLSDLTGEYVSQNAGSQKVTFTNTAADWTLSDTNYKLADSGHVTYAFGKITKKDQAAPTAPTVNGSTVTVAESDREKKLEYSLDNTTWISVPALDRNGAFTLSGLAQGEHTVYLRVKESSNCFASPSVSTAFELTQYSVAYNANGGVGSIASQTANSGSSVSVKSGSGFSRTGYSFTGWNTKADGSGTSYAAGTSINSGATLYAQWNANTYTVRFNANGGSGTMANESFTYDADAKALTTNAFTRTSYTFTGWATSANGPVLYSDKQEVKNLAGSGTVTLYAIWAQDVHNITANVISPNNNKGVQIKLLQGNAVYAVENNVIMTTDGALYKGAKVFEGIPAGTYNIVAVQNIEGDKNVTVTKSVVLTEDGSVTIVLPASGVNSVLEVKEDTRPAVVGGLEEEAESNRQSGKDVTVKMTVEKQEEQQLAATASEHDKATQDAISEIKAEANGKTLEFMNIEIEKTTTIIGESVEPTKEAITETEKVLELVFSYEMNGKRNIKVYREHDGEVQEFIENNSKKDGTFYLDKTNHLLYIYAQKFSTYAIGYEQESYYPGGSETTYAITSADTENGKLTVSTKYAKAGQTVTITATPDESYKLNTLTVKDAKGNVLTLTKVSDTTYTFKMPSSGVSVSAAFAKLGACPQDETCVYAKFTDADTKAWYHDGIHFCVENDYMVGVAADKFAPSGTLSRAMIVTMLWRMEGSPVVNYAMSFEDVAADQWYTEAIRWAQSTGVVLGYDAEHFGPGDDVTREQLAAILMRYAAFKGIDVSQRNDLNRFTDKNTVSGWALENVKWANAVGIINGRTKTTIVPTGNATRAEAACMVQRFCETLLK